MITVYKYVVYSKNIMFLKYLLFAHRNDCCMQMLLSGKTEVASILVKWTLDFEMDSQEVSGDLEANTLE